MRPNPKRSTRRILLRRSGELVAASITAPFLSVAGEEQEDDAGPLAKFVLGPSNIWVDERQAHFMRREIASVGKMVARLRDVKLRNGDEPASVFRA